jgi:Transposase DDE domain
MKRFVLGMDRVQSTLLPECLDDFIDESNPVRAIDAFVNALNSAELGFDGVSPAATGRPSYHPSVLLKLYIYEPGSEHHLIITHEVTNSGSDRAQLANVAKQAKTVLETETLEAVADRGYFNSPEILACHEAGIAVTLPKPLTSGAKSDGRFGKQDFAYLADEDVYRCQAGERLPYRYTNEEAGKILRRYWATACSKCPLKSQCTRGPERRITRWEHEHLLDDVQRRLDANPQAMRQRRETVEHPFGTIKARMGATHFLMKTLPKVAAEMALSVLAYNLTRVINILGTGPLIAAIRA